MSHVKEKTIPLEEIPAKDEVSAFSTVKCNIKEPSNDSKSVPENQTKLISIGQQDTLRLDKENPTLKIDQSAGSSNQGDSLDKDDGYLSSSRQTSTRYSSSCTDDNKTAGDPSATYAKIQGSFKL